LGLGLEGISKPTVVCGVRIVAHESVVHHLIAVENLAVDITLVIIPHAVACFRKDRVDRQQESHLRRLEDSAPWIDQRISLAVDDEAFTKLLSGQMVVDFAESSHSLECGCAQKSIANCIDHPPSRFLTSVDTELLANRQKPPEWNCVANTPVTTRKTEAH
jgi:hypothetical protein